MGASAKHSSQAPFSHWKHPVLKERGERRCFPKHPVLEEKLGPKLVCFRREEEERDEPESVEEPESVKNQNQLKKNIQEPNKITQKCTLEIT